MEEFAGLFSKLRSGYKKASTAQQVRTAAARAATPTSTFSKLASKIKNAAVKAAVVENHRNTLRGIDGIFNMTSQKIANGTATPQDTVDNKKSRVLITLEATDYDAYRLASIYMPYVTDIDEESGAYCFPTQELADVAAWGEEELVKYTSNPHHTEYGLQGLFKKIGKAFQNAAKSVAKAVTTTAKTVAKATTSAVKSTVNTVKATANVVKAGVQAATGKTSAAKETIKKAGQQAKAAVVEPVKTAVQNTKDIAKDVVINPIKTAVKDTIDITKETIKIAGKVFKVLFIKINPVTILIRSAIRAACSLNLFGVATKFGVGLMTQANAIQSGYTAAQWSKAQSALAKFKKLFKKMGGKEANLEKSIKNGANKKPLFKSDIRPDQKMNFDRNDNAEVTNLAEPMTVAAIIAAASSVLVVVLKWVADIQAQKKAAAETKQQEQRADQQAAEAKAEADAQKQYNLEHYECDANGNPIVDQYGRPVPKGQIDADQQAAAMAAAQQDDKKKSNTLIWVALGVAVVGGGALLLGGKKKKRR